MKISKKRYLLFNFFMSVIAVIGLLTTVIAGDALTKKETDNQSSVSQNPTRKPESSTDEETITPCPEPRPRLCTMDYRPVCAKLNTSFPSAALKHIQTAVLPVRIRLSQVIAMGLVSEQTMIIPNHYQKNFDKLSREGTEYFEDDI